MVGEAANEVPRPGCRSCLWQLQVLGAVGLAILLLAGCTAGRHALIEITPAGVFSPGTLVVPAGTAVVWHNAGTRPRTVLYDPSLAEERSDLQALMDSPAWNSGLLYPGASYAHTFDQPGTYLIFSSSAHSVEVAGLIRVDLGTVSKYPEAPAPANGGEAP